MPPPKLTSVTSTAIRRTKPVITISLSLSQPLTRSNSQSFLIAGPFNSCVTADRWQHMATLTLECHPELISHFKGFPNVGACVAFGSDVSFADCRIPLMSLPLALGTSLESIPATVPYLFADLALLHAWRTQLAVPPGHLAVGLVWAGNPGHKNDRNRSLSPDLLGALGNLANVSFYCLQQKPQSQVFTGLQFAGIYDELKFPDTAAIVSNLDLVISVDTAVAHLAGALGKPVWTLLPFPPRLALDARPRRPPWYPTPCASSANPA